MIQVHYRWRLKPERLEDFERAWLRATHAIRRTRPGAYGSMLVHGTEDPTALLATAYWASEEAWSASRALGPTDPEASRVMAECAELVTTEFFEVLHDVYAPPSG